jgi:hypothetical protein
MKELKLCFLSIVLGRMLGSEQDELVEEWGALMYWEAVQSCPYARIVRAVNRVNDLALSQQEKQNIYKELYWRIACVFLYSPVGGCQCFGGTSSMFRVGEKTCAWLWMWYWIN